MIRYVDNSRFLMSTIIAELADGYNVYEICEDYNLDKDTVIKNLNELSEELDKIIAEKK
jgi:uncharacterized protein (DUF433 family)